MALSLVLRNASKFNAAGFLKSARLTPLKTYTTVVATQRALAVKPATLLKNALPLSRNISLTAPKMAMGSNHTPLWTAERIISLTLVGALPLAFVVSSQVTDAILAIAVVLHTHWGVEAMVVDYLRPAVVGSVVSKAAHISLFALSVITLAGLFYLIHNDIGITKTIKQIWAIKGKEAQA